MGDRKKRNASRDPCFCVTERTENNNENDCAGHPSDPSGLGSRCLCHRLRGRPSEARAARLGESEEQGEVQRRRVRVRESESQCVRERENLSGSQSEGNQKQGEGQGQDEGRWHEGQGQGLEQEEIQVQEEQKREESEEVLSCFSRLPACLHVVFPLQPTLVCAYQTNCL